MLPVDRAQHRQFLDVIRIKELFAHRASILQGTFLELFNAVQSLLARLSVTRAQLGSLREGFLRLVLSPRIPVQNTQTVLDMEIPRSEHGSLVQPLLGQVQLAFLEVGGSKVIGSVWKGWSGGRFVQILDRPLPVAFHKVQPAQVIHDVRMVADRSVDRFQFCAGFFELL